MPLIFHYDSVGERGRTSMSDNTDLVPIGSVREAEVVEDMPFIPDSRVPWYEKEGAREAAIEYVNAISRPRHKSDEIRKQERHKAKCEDAAMIRGRKIPLQTFHYSLKPEHRKQNPMTEFFNDLIEKLAQEVEKSE